MVSSLSSVQSTPPFSATGSSQLGQFLAGDDELIRFLNHLSRSSLKAATVTHVHTFEQGDVIGAKSELMQNMYILLEGSINMVCESAKGTRLVVSTLEPGSVFGEGALPASNEPKVMMEAAEDGKIVCVPAREARNMVVQHPILGWALLQTYGQRMLQVEQNMEDVAYKTLPERLAKLLLEFSNYENGLINGVSHQMLADHMGTYRETISAILREFKSDGVVELGYRRITVTDQEGLKYLAATWEW